MANNLVPLRTSSRLLNPLTPSPLYLVKFDCDNKLGYVQKKNLTFISENKVKYTNPRDRSEFFATVLKIGTQKELDKFAEDYVLSLSVTENEEEPEDLNSILFISSQNNHTSLEPRPLISNSFTYQVNDSNTNIANIISENRSENQFTTLTNAGSSTNSLIYRQAPVDIVQSNNSSSRNLDAVPSIFALNSSSLITTGEFEINSDTRNANVASNSPIIQNNSLACNSCKYELSTIKEQIEKINEKIDEIQRFSKPPPLVFSNFNLIKILNKKSK